MYDEVAGERKRLSANEKALAEVEHSLAARRSGKR